MHQLSFLRIRIYSCNLVLDFVLFKTSFVLTLLWCLLFRFDRICRASSFVNRFLDRARPSASRCLWARSASLPSGRLAPTWPKFAAVWRTEYLRWYFGGSTPLQFYCTFRFILFHWSNPNYTFIWSSKFEYRNFQRCFRAFASVSSDWQALIAINPAGIHPRGHFESRFWPCLCGCWRHLKGLNCFNWT